MSWSRFASLLLGHLWALSQFVILASVAALCLIDEVAAFCSLLQNECWSARYNEHDNGCAGLSLKRIVRPP